MVNLNHEQLPLRCEIFRKILTIFQLENKPDMNARILMFTSPDKVEY